MKVRFKEFALNTGLNTGLNLFKANADTII